MKRYEVGKQVGRRVSPATETDSYAKAMQVAHRLVREGSTVVLTMRPQRREAGAGS